MTSSLQEELTLAEALIRKGEERVRGQRELTARLSRKGLDTAIARQLLSQFEEVQRLQIAKRDQLLAELQRALT
jgi:SOS response regulatory protein OraA/RecX